MQNEKLHTTTCPGSQSETEHYHFGADGNMRLYSYDRLFYSLYGYDGGTTRTYKYSFDLNPQWVNGRLEAVNFNLHTAMFYPNSYLNFNSNGHYTKHYYNGMERIASRLGDNNLSLATQDPELQDRKEWQDSLIRKNILEITGYEFLEPGEEPDPDDPKPIYELPQVSITNLVPNTSSIYYYHSNHLGSTAFITDQNQTIVQGFLYAPFGEITNEYNNSFGSSVLPKYSFNAKELDEETGMYYYEARYMAPPVFTSRDPLFEKYPTFSPYAYCANNPVKYVDPDGRFPISIHKEIVTDAINHLSIRTSTNRYDLLAHPLNHGNIRYGVGNYADIVNYSNPAIHFDGKVGFQSCVSHWKNVSNSLSKSYNNRDFVSFGRDLHTVADFYSHSNYVELYVSYYTDVLKKNLNNFDINSIPTFDDALADPKLSNYLKKNKLRTGDYGKGTDPSSETHHDRMNKDRPTSERGRKRINSKYTYYDAALNVANRSTRQKMEGVTK